MASSQDLKHSFYPSMTSPRGVVCCLITKATEIRVWFVALLVIK